MIECLLGSYLMKMAAGAAITVAGAVLALPALGFTSAGVAAGSIAAFIQSMIGNVAAGGVFAMLQSAGVIGLGSSTMAILGSVGAFLGSIIF